MTPPARLAQLLRGVQVVALDLDGTTLDPSHRLAPRTAAAIAAAEGCGVRVIAATGRPVAECRAFRDRHTWRPTMIASNGAAVLHRDGALSRSGLPAGPAARTVRRLRAASPRLRLALVRDDVDGLDPGFPADLAADWNLVEDEIPSTEAALETRRPVQKLLVWHPEGPPAAAEVVERAHVDVACTASTSRFLELGPPGVSKGSALAALLARWQVSSAHCAAIGDMPNDLPMLRRAGVALAVANAHPDVLAACDHVLPDHADHGVAVALEALYAARAGRLRPPSVAAGGHVPGRVSGPACDGDGPGL